MYLPLCNMLSNHFALFSIYLAKIRELNDICWWPRDCPGKLDRALGRPKLWTKNQVLEL